MAQQLLVQSRVLEIVSSPYVPGKHALELTIVVEHKEHHQRNANHPHYNLDHRRQEGRDAGEQSGEVDRHKREQLSKVGNINIREGNARRPHIHSLEGGNG